LKQINFEFSLKPQKGEMPKGASTDSKAFQDILRLNIRISDIDWSGGNPRLRDR